MWIEPAVFFLVLFGLAYPIGHYCHWALCRAHIAPWEEKLARLIGFDPHEQMGWKCYTASLLGFNALGLLVLYGLLRLQHLLPGNPRQFGPMSWDLAFNTAASFVTNTNWQAYSGESSLSYLSQAAGLTPQNFLSAATGIAVMLVLGRCLTSARSATVGNFWLDLSRSIGLVLLPLSLILALLLTQQGVIQSNADYRVVQSASGNHSIPLGAAASQIAIKQLGSNGGGYFGVNSCHPLENPTPLSNFLELLAILLLPVSLCITFGLQVGDRRQGQAILAAMVLLFVPLLAMSWWSELQPNPSLGLNAINMEGKEMRFNPLMSSLWSVATTATSNGSVNCMHDSLSPLAGLSTLLAMLLGEVVFGGVGCGVYGMVVFAIVAVFVAGLMVGRTPEYLGKKIEPFEMKMCSLFILFTPAVVLGLSSLAVLYAPAREAVTNHGPHAFSEILYACASMGNNNGSAFGGLNANIPFYNVLGGVAMLISRFWLIIPILALSGSLASKKITPISSGTLPTHDHLFIVWLAGVVAVVGVLSFLPALALGPIVESLQMNTGATF